MTIDWVEVGSWSLVAAVVMMALNAAILIWDRFISGKDDDDDSHRG
ncbi:hypothetical protein LCGC14_0813640 [marine sediment metagenome]|uniref:Uncharacterized protein n=1 Tax=marine sediment metagenome TaxID=412755 RepID=A0A0F9Q650_9ZZZZ